MVNQLFATHISTFFAVDVIISAVIIIIYILNKGKEIKKSQKAIALLGTLLIGPSFRLPIFLFFESEI